MSDTGLSDTNTVLNREKLLEWLSGAYKGNPEDILKVLQDNPDRDKDKRSIMRKTGRESIINSTTGQGLGSVIDNMPYYVDSCAWWIKGWDAEKYKKSLSRNKKKVRRPRIPRAINRK